ncbi:MAG: single-stranded DNA-binding protein [Clostridiales bacterium]|nr:single-stranded DNA-binding protein [Clostridiales bacterium]
MNKAIIIGNLTKDPELTQTTSGISVCRFTLAVSRKFTNADGERETDFLNIVVWRNLADICHKYLKKGSKAAVTGTIQTRSYDAQDGSKRYVTEIVAEDIEFVGAKTNGASEEKEEVSKLEPISDDGDDLPF